LSTALNTTCGWKTVRGGEPSFGTYDEYRLDMCNDGKRLNGNWRGIGAAGRRLGTRLVNRVEHDLRAGGLSRVFGHMMDIDLTFATVASV